MHMGDPYTGQRKGPAGAEANTPIRLPAAHTVSTQNKHRMRVNHVREVCQERKPTLHTHRCAHTPQHVHSTLSPARPPGRGRERQGSPRPPLVPSGTTQGLEGHPRDRLRPGEFLTQLLRTMRPGTHAPGRAQEGVAGPQPGWQPCSHWGQRWG